MSSVRKRVNVSQILKINTAYVLFKAKIYFAFVLSEH